MKNSHDINNSHDRDISQPRKRTKEKKYTKTHKKGLMSISSLRPLGETTKVYDTHTKPV